MQNPSMINCKMGVRSLQLTIPTCLTPSNLVKRGSFHGQFPKFCHPRRYPASRRIQFLHIRAHRLLGAASVSSATVEGTSEDVNSKDEDIVFVAGATGRVGSRTVRELLKLGFRVKAGVRGAQRAESLVQSVRQMKLDPESTGGVQPIEKLELVKCDLEKRDQIVPALGRSSVVICCIGASEKEAFDVFRPYRIDYQATKNLIDAATVAKVDHFILVTSLGTNKVGFPAALLNLFWGVLIWKRKAEEALIDSGLPYTIVRPGGMERPTDSFKETHNLILYPEDTLFGGLVSNLQVAELLAFMAQNRELSYCKIVEAIAETTVPLTPMGELLAKIPSKRAYISKAKTAKAAVITGSSPPKVTVTDAAKDKEPSKEKSEPDAATQLLEPEPKISISEVPTSPTGKEAVQEESVVPRPSSPYTAYEDWKPPSSPSPTPSVPQENKIEVTDASPALLETSSGVSAADVPSSELAVESLMKKQPISPYAVYKDLKPSTSPSPSTPSSPQEEPSETSITVDGVPNFDGTMVKKQPLSPYAVYEDLKPPTLPSPSTPVDSREEPPEVLKTVDGVPNVIDGSLIKNVSQESTSYHSPYPAYDDLKPPTSPTPTSPTLSSSTTAASAADETQMATPSDEDAAEPIKADEAGDVESSTEPKSRPLSPYAMYDDMKPPTNPTPTPRNH